MKLTDVVDRINGNVDRFTTELEYYIGGEHFESNELEVTQKGLLKENLGKLGFKFHFAFQDRDVVFMARNPHLRKAGMVRFAGLCSDASYILRSKDETVLSQEYLAVMLQSDHFWDYCESHKVGSVNFANNWSSIANYEFELPTPEEQKEISDKVWAAYRLKKSYKKLLAATEEMVKSQFIEMFGDFHNKVQIKDVCLVVSGKSIPTKLEDIDGNNPYIKVADFNIPGNEKYITIAQRYVSDDSASYSKQIPEGSVIFAKNGAASMSNKKRLTKIRCCIDMNTMAVFPKNESILSDFLFATIEAMDVSSHVRQGAIPSISPKSIEDSYIAMPTMEEQYRYVSIAKHADKSGFELRKSIEAIDQVIKSLINN